VSPRQENARTVNPNGLDMIVGAAYEREIAASLTRTWENVDDWEHLPWLHEGSFSACDLEAQGDWGWRAWTKGPASDAPDILIELVTDKPNQRYVSRTLEGGLPGMEIWTRFEALAPQRTGVHVEFHIPGLKPDQTKALGASMVTLYKTLWDEDERMMVERQAALDAKRKQTAGSTIPLGPVDELRASLPLTIDQGGRVLKLIDHQGNLLAFPATCPHMLAPLKDAPIDDEGCLICPWHGYRFDIRTGTEQTGRSLTLGPLPKIAISDGQAHLTWPHKKTTVI